MKYTLENISQQLRHERSRLGLTQREFAKLAGTNQARISIIENGEVDLRISTLLELARNLDLEFMLVPRQHVPAVNAIIKPQPLSTEQKSQRLAIGRLRKLVIRLAERFPDDRHLSDILRIVKELSNFRLRVVNTKPILKATKALKLIEETPALIGTARGQVDDLRHLRNTLVHNLTKEEYAPKPAYHLDEEEHD